MNHTFRPNSKTDSWTMGFTMTFLAGYDAGQNSPWKCMGVTRDGHLCEFWIFEFHPLWILGFKDSLFQDPSFVAFDNRSVDRGVGEPRLLTPTNELATQNDRLIEKMCATESILSR